MEGELLYFTTADMIEEQGGDDREDGGMGFQRKPPIVNRIISGAVDVESLKNTIKTLSDALNSDEIKVGAFAIDKLEVSLGINGSGQVGILGTGTQMGADVSIKVVLKKNKTDKDDEAKG